MLSNFFYGFPHFFSLILSAERDLKYSSSKKSQKGAEGAERDLTGCTWRAFHIVKSLTIIVKYLTIFNPSTLPGVFFLGLTPCACRRVVLKNE